MPKGWSFDKTVGSPLAGYAFVSNGKSVIHGQKRALLLVRAPQGKLFYSDMPRISLQINNENTQPKPKQIIDAQYVRTVNDLAREKFKHRLMNDILVDLTICEIEGWCKREYINELKELLGGIACSHILQVVSAPTVKHSLTVQSADDTNA